MVNPMIRLLSAGAAALSITAPLAAAGNPWNGTWVLDAARSSAEAKDGAAEAYRFTIDPRGHIRWEIPSLGEVANGRTDGTPMAIHRPHATANMTLSVVADGKWTLRYRVFRDAKLIGGGQMTLVDDGKAWVDLTWPGNHEAPGAFVTYVRR